MKKLYAIFLTIFIGVLCLNSGFTSEAQNQGENTTNQPAVSPNIVISQFFGGGGVASASPYRNDFVELFNRGGSPVSLNGMSVQYSFAGDSTWQVTTLPNVTLAPGQYFLIQFAQSANGSGAALPTPDATGSTNMHPINGKAAVVNSTTALSGACPITDPSIVDFLGYGTGGCFEGSSQVNGMSITVAAVRNGMGCFDTDQNASDFTVASPAPRNTASATTSCGTIAVPLSGSGSVNPNTAAPNQTVLFTVNVTPADTPPSTGIGVSADLTSVEGPSNQMFFDDGTNGDITPNDNVFSFAYLIPSGIAGGVRNITATITDAQARTANAVIVLNVNAPFGDDDPLLLGNPSNATPDVANENNYLMFKPQYSLSYNRSRATANWVAWRLDSTWIGSAPRQDDFRPDPALPASWYHVQTSDYTGSGYDRGHMTPSGDRTRSIADNSATFLMTNIVPQLAANNQGPWEDFESYLRSLAQNGNEMYIVSGVAGNIGTISQGRIVVPKYTWKVVIVLPNGNNDLERITKQTRTIAILIPNQPPVSQSAPWRDFRKTVDQIEALTGYNFFSNVPKITQEIIERRRDLQ